MKAGIFVHSLNPRDQERCIYFDILSYNGIDCIYLTQKNLSNPDAWKDLDFIIYKWTHQHDDGLIASTILPIMEKTGKAKIFPNWETSWTYDDKIKQDYLLKINGFPFIESWIFYDRELALDWVQKAEYPLVFKLAHGSGSQNVFLVRTVSEAQKLVKQMFGKGRMQDSLNLFLRWKLLNRNLGRFYRYYRNRYFNFLRHKDSTPYWQIHKNYIYFQKFCPNNDYDTRVSTAGLRAHAFKRFVRKGDFRASGGNKWDINPEHIDKRMIRIALDISKHYSFQAMAYDFVYDENKEPRIVEMSYAYGGAGYPDFMNGYWDFDLNWHPGRFYPQYFELVDLTQDDNLKCPDIEVKTHYTNVEIISQ